MRRRNVRNLNINTLPLHRSFAESAMSLPSEKPAFVITTKTHDLLPKLLLVGQPLRRKTSLALLQPFKGRFRERKRRRFRRCRRRTFQWRKLRLRATLFMPPRRAKNTPKNRAKLNLPLLVRKLLKVVAFGGAARTECLKSNRFLIT